MILRLSAERQNIGPRLRLALLALFLSCLLASGAAAMGERPAAPISDCVYGKITVSGTTYESDIAILPDGTVRAAPDNMHYMQVEDMEELIPPGTRLLLIGAGSELKAKPPAEVKKFLGERNIELRVLPTDEAVRLYNSMPPTGVVALFHLRC